jgi:metal-dependent amidase/aminoacylase/carboxypeptidase family protein
MPTAFVARAGTSGGPVIAILAEMDALPGMSQAADPDRKPIPNQIAGHACGHHLFGSGAVAAASLAASARHFTADSIRRSGTSQISATTT